MTEIQIYRGENPLAIIKPDDNSVQEKVIMGVNELRITHKTRTFIDFSLNDYCIVFGETYTLYDLPEIKKESTYEYQYTMTFRSFASALENAQYLFYGDDNTIKEPDFSLMGKPADFINLLLKNIERVQPGWEIGQVIDANYQNITFSNVNCYEALQQIAEAFGTEFWVFGKKIYLVKYEKDIGQTFRHGRYKGLYDVTRTNISNSKIATRLYVYGSDKNIPADYRNYQKRLLMTNGIRYLDQNTDLYGIIEAAQIFEEVYPHRTGTVTAVDAGNFYKFNDSGIDFNVNDYLLPGLTAKVTFNTGQLTGYTFDISSFNNSTKEFTILKNKDENIIDVPSSVLKPAIGDKYVLIDIKMPNSYVLDAENELQLAGLNKLNELSSPQITYQVTIDPLYLKLRNLTVDIGDLVWISDQQLGVNRKIRITNITRNIVNEWEFTITLSDVIKRNVITELQFQQKTRFQQIRELINKLQEKAILNNNQIGQLNIIQGGITAIDIDNVASSSGLHQLYIDPVTGKFVRLSP